jgi:hypothetical protein
LFDSGGITGGVLRAKGGRTVIFGASAWLDGLGEKRLGGNEYGESIEVEDSKFVWVQFGDVVG